jgi:hypothetical protein
MQIPEEALNDSSVVAIPTFRVVCAPVLKVRVPAGSTMASKTQRPIFDVQIGGE